MKVNEVTQGLKLFRAVVKLQQTGYKQLISTTVAAKNMQMAIKLLKAQYGKDSVVGNPKLVQDLSQ